MTGSAPGAASGAVSRVLGGQDFGGAFGCGRCLLRTVQARRQFLRQFAERPAFDRTQSRRHFGFGRWRWAKRHDISGRRNDTECGPFHMGCGFGRSFGRCGGLGFFRRRSGGWRGFFLLGRRFRRRHETDRMFAASARQLVDAVDVATDAETAIAAEAAVAVEYRQTRHFDRQPLAGIVHRPGYDDAAPGFAARHRARDEIVGIEPQLGGNFAPRPAECRRRVRAGEFDEFVRSDAEAAARIHVPNETQRVPLLGYGLMRGGRRRLCSRHGGCDRRRGDDCLEQRRRGWRSHRVVCRVLRPDLLARGFARPLRHREGEHARSVFAEPRRGDLERYVTQMRRSAGASGFEHRGGKRLDAERRQHGRAGKPCLCRRIGINERAVRRESRERFLAIADQAAYAFAECQLRSRRLRCGDQHRDFAIGKNDARAGAGQRAAEARAEAAQPLEPLLGGRRQAGGKTDDLRGGSIPDIESALGAGSRSSGAEDRRADRIGPQDLRAVDAPQPSRPFTRRKRCETRMT